MNRSNVNQQSRIRHVTATSNLPATQMMLVIAREADSQHLALQTNPARDDDCVRYGRISFLASREVRRCFSQYVALHLYARQLCPQLPNLDLLSCQLRSTPDSRQLASLVSMNPVPQCLFDDAQRPRRRRYALTGLHQTNCLKLELLRVCLPRYSLHLLRSFDIFSERYMEYVLRGQAHLAHTMAMPLDAVVWKQVVQIKFIDLSGFVLSCAPILPSAQLQQASNREYWKSSSSRLRKSARSYRFGSSDGYSGGTAAYQLPLSPKMSMTRARRAQPFCQLVCRARSTPSGSPATTAAIISSCSLTERWRSLIIELA